MFKNTRIVLIYMIVVIFFVGCGGNSTSSGEGQDNKEVKQSLQTKPLYDNSNVATYLPVTEDSADISLD